VTARIVLIGSGALGLGDEIARAIRAAHVIAPEPVGAAEVRRELADSTDGFVLEAFPRTVAEAEELDAFLDERAASIEIALWVGPDAAPSPLEDDLLRHYRHRVVEVDLGGLLPGEEHELLARALAGIREASESLVG
jgi:hypothetical protein